MAYLILPSRWNRQPPVGTRAHFGHESAGDLRGLIDARTGLCAVTGRFVSNRPNTFAGTTAGLAADTTPLALGVGNNNGERWSQWETPQFTAAIFWQKTAAPGTSIIGGLGYPGLGGYSIGTAFSDYLRVYTGGLIVDSGAQTDLYGAPNLIFVTYDGATCTTYSRGKQVAQTGGGAALAWDTYSVPSMGYAVAVGAYPANFLYQAHWGRVLNALEIAEIHKRPWSLFAPIQRRIFAGPAAGGADTTITPPVGSVIVAGNAPTLVTDSIRQPAAGSVVVSGLVPTLVIDSILQPAAGSVVVAGNAPDVLTGTIVSPTVGSVVVAGNAPTVSVTEHQTVAPSVGSIVVAGNAPTLVVDTIMAPSAGAVIVAGNAPDVLAGVAVSPAAGSIVVAGNAPTLDVTDHRVFSPDTGNIIVSGNAPTVIATGAFSATQLAELYGGNIISKRLADAKKGGRKKKREKEPLEEMVFEVAKTPEGKQQLIQFLPKQVQDELPVAQMALVSDLVKKIEQASTQVQKKVERIYRQREEDDEDDVFILLM